MRWLPNISFLSSSSSSSTASSSSSSSSSSAFRSTSCGIGSSDSRQKKPSSASADGNLSGGSVCSRRKLTRQRRLQHFTGENVLGVARWSDSHSLDSPEEGLRRWSTSCDHLQNASSSTPSAVPQPLPLPEFSPVFRRKENSGEGDCRLPSPKSGPSRGVEDRADGIGGEGVSANTRIRSVFSSRETRTQDHAEMRSSRKGDNDRNGFRIEIPIKSAPSSRLSSPGLSPRRQSVGDVLTYHYVVPQGNQVWSAPEMPTGDIIGGHHPPSFFDYPALSNDSSPLNSPQGRSTCQNPRSPGSTSPLHSKLSFETSTPRREGSASLEVHPLPLPPGAVISSPTVPVPIPQVTAKPESLPLKSQWQKGKLIGRGTFGSVYVASNRETGALCAMKEVEMLPDDPKSAECIKQLQQEIKVLSQLKHPNIVQYYGSEIIQDRFYIYLEYVHPGSINKYVREHCGAITESVVRNFTRHILSGLAYLHSTKTIHRDIKGANLLVDSSGVVKLADFGMAKHLTGQVSNLSLKGSPYWMAPELMQAVMQKDTSSDLALAVDIWSLGCTIIEMFTGKPPWNEYEGAAAMFKVMKDTPPIPETLSSEGKDFLRCCFQRNPAERPTAVKLLEHRFLKNSLLLDVPSFPPLLSGMKLPDKPHSLREQSESKLDQSPVSLSTPISRGKVMTFDSETCQQSHPDACDLTVACRQSPRSILEALPGLSPPRSAHNTYHPSSSAYVASYVINGVKKNRI